MDTQETRTFTLFLIIIVTVGIILAYFIHSILRQQKRYLKLQKGVVLAELAAIENERTRIAADLHDDVSPLLSVVKFQVNSIDTASEEEKAQLQAASQYLDDIVRRLREISTNLMPSSLLQKGLIVATKEYISRVEAASGMKIDFSYDDALAPYSHLYAHLYRIIQEVIHNARKHARASAMTVRLERRGQQLQLFFCDNGIGFNYKEMLAKRRGIGIQSMTNRVRVLGGTLAVESEKGRGAAYLFTIPLDS